MQWVTSLKRIVEISRGLCSSSKGADHPWKRASIGGDIAWRYNNTLDKHKYIGHMDIDSKGGSNWGIASRAGELYTFFPQGFTGAGEYGL
jgi:hypothetical protein